CQEGDQSFSQCLELGVHEQLHNGKKSHNCLEYGKSFSQRSSMIHHGVIRSGERP
ncbi:ZNF22 protein, partial [Anthoscopus minutus]|nr:ZNF22 protein [Anthoscopus minutus]